MNTFLVAVCALTLTTGAAFAGEGTGRGPFEVFPSHGVVTIVAADSFRAQGVGQEAFPALFNQRVVHLSSLEELLPANGADGVVQTANSLPAGFAIGSVAFTQHQSVLAYLNNDAARKSAVLMAQKTAAADRRG